jgi:hypothetical protein
MAPAAGGGDGRSRLVGGTAARLGRRALAGTSGVALIDLPSSSAAHARPFAEKLSRWTALGPYLG